MKYLSNLDITSKTKCQIPFDLELKNIIKTVLVLLSFLHFINCCNILSYVYSRLMVKSY